MKLSAIVSLPAAAAANPAALFTPVAGRPALARIVATLTDAADLHSIVVAAPNPWAAQVRARLDSTAVFVLSVADGVDGLDAAVAHLRAENVSHALVADYRQVLIVPAVVSRVVAALEAGASRVVPVMPVTDTVKSVDAQGRILRTVDRSVLCVAQSPYGVSIADRAGSEFSTVKGDPGAVVADLPADRDLLEAIIACRD